MPKCEFAFRTMTGPATVPAGAAAFGSFASTRVAVCVVVGCAALVSLGIHVGVASSYSIVIVVVVVRVVERAIHVRANGCLRVEGCVDALASNVKIVALALEA